MTVRYTLGGSDCAAAAGVHPYVSRLELWAQMTGRMARAESDAMAWGRRLEPLVADVLADQGYTILPAPAEGYADPERPWCVGHPDRFTVASGPVPAVLEIKTTGQWAQHGHGATLPLHYQAQAQWYMHLTGRQHAVVAVLVGGQRLTVSELARDEYAVGRLLELGEAFLALVRTDRPPDPDGSDSARAAVVSLFPEAEPAKVVRLSGEAWGWVQELRARKQQADVIAGQIRELESRLKLAMGDAELAISPHDTDALRWTTVQARRLDQRALKAARPEVVDEFMTVTTTRRFTLL